MSLIEIATLLVLAPEQHGEFWINRSGFSSPAGDAASAPGETKALARARAFSSGRGAIPLRVQLNFALKF